MIAARADTRTALCDDTLAAIADLRIVLLSLAEYSAASDLRKALYALLRLAEYSDTALERLPMSLPHQNCDCLGW